MGETTMPQNFTLFRDFVKQAVEQFITAQKTMDVVHDALGLDPQCEESARLVRRTLWRLWGRRELGR